MTSGGGEQEAGLYVHVPFCSFVCPYCDFAVKRSVPGAEDAWLEALLAEAALRGDWSVPFDSLYLGGGTPSLLGASRLGRLLDGLRARLPIKDDAVLHMEANPEDVGSESLLAWRELGVAFLSLGVQSFDDRELRFLGRRHDAAGARRALAAAINANFDVLSVDLIFGLPDQVESRWRSNIEAATPEGVDHLSCYQLTVKPGTLFSKRVELGRLQEISDEQQGDFYLATHAALAERGFEAYEISNFARRPEARSRHNRKYWNHSPYLGLGPAAHSFAGHDRFWNARDEGEWRAAVTAGRLAEASRESLSEEELLVEALMLGLRQSSGLDLAELHRRFGYELPARASARIEAMALDGLLEVEGDLIRPTPAGMAVADSIAADLAP